MGARGEFDSNSFYPTHTIVVPRLNCINLSFNERLISLTPNDVLIISRGPSIISIICPTSSCSYLGAWQSKGDKLRLQYGPTHQETSPASWPVQRLGRPYPTEIVLCTRAYVPHLCHFFATARRNHYFWEMVPSDSALIPEASEIVDLAEGNSIAFTTSQRHPDPWGFRADERSFPAAPLPAVCHRLFRFLTPYIEAAAGFCDTWLVALLSPPPRTALLMPVATR